MCFARCGEQAGRRPTRTPAGRRRRTSGEECDPLKPLRQPPRYGGMRRRPMRPDSAARSVHRGPRTPLVEHHADALAQRLQGERDEPAFERPASARSHRVAKQRDHPVIRCQPQRAVRRGEFPRNGDRNGGRDQPAARLGPGSRRPRTVLARARGTPRSGSRGIDARPLVDARPAVRPHRGARRRPSDPHPMPLRPSTAEPRCHRTRPRGAVDPTNPLHPDRGKRAEAAEPSI